MEGDKVVGVKATDKLGNTYTVNANNGVILATGGFAGNVELRQEYCEGEKWQDLSDKVMTTNLKAITGDGIIMAREIGVSLIDMDQIQLLHLGNALTGSTKGVIPYKGRNSDEVIFVNSNGERFVTEDGRRDVMCNAILQQDGGFYWMIHDSKNIDPKSDQAENYIKGGYLYRAETLEELAVMIGASKENLVASVNQYNTAVETSVDELTGRKLLVTAIEEGPFFAAKRVPSAHHTMGGVEIDTDSAKGTGLLSHIIFFCQLLEIIEAKNKIVRNLTSMVQRYLLLMKGGHMKMQKCNECSNNFKYKDIMKSILI